jgi:hypothetical protein
MRTPSPLLIAVGLALLAACGGSQPAPSTPAAGTASDSGTSAAPAASATAAPAVTDQPDSGATVASANGGAAPATKSWKDMSHEERLALMKNSVLPKMKAAFQSFDAKDYADFSCMTCHGEGVKKGKFDMPYPGLPKLDAKDGFKKIAAKHPAAMKFMEQTVEPTMAEILGLPKWDQATNPTGFGCQNCHTMD